MPVVDQARRTDPHPSSSSGSEDAPGACGGGIRRGLTVVGPPALFVAIWTSGYLVGAIGTRSAAPLSLLFWRFAVAGAAITVVALVTRAPWPRGPRAWSSLLATGALLHTAQFGGVYLGLSLGVPAGLASLVVSASPLAIAALGVPLFAERLRPAQWAGLLLGLTGVAAAVTAELGGTLPLGGVALVGLGLAGFVAGTLLHKRLGRDRGASTDLRTGLAVQLMGATVTGAPLAALGGGFGIPLTTAAIGSVLWLALVCSLGGFTLLFVLLRRRTGGSATSYLFLVPPVTAVVGVPVLGETLVPGALVGIVLSAVGVALVTRRARR